MPQMIIDNMDSPRPSKRRRVSDSQKDEKDVSLVKSPAESTGNPSKNDNGNDNDNINLDNLFDRATHILSTEAAALSHITRLYRTDSTVQKGLTDAVTAIVQAQNAGGKLIACGVGKSAYIAMKLVATCKSLGVAASFMHACEAMHGDLGDVRTHDVLLFVSFSGKSPELLNVLSHVPPATRVVALTSHTEADACPLLSDRDWGTLLSAPIVGKEEDLFGVAAPTISTTVALAVADMLVLTVADELHGHRKKEVFKRNHPGGAIGMNHQAREKLKRDRNAFEAVELLPSPSLSGSDDG